MNDLKGYAICYAILFLTGIPFLFLVGYVAWAIFRRRRLRETKLLPLLMNTFMYPFAFLFLRFVITKVFGVDQEAARVISETVRLNQQAGGPPESHNPALAMLFIGGFYFFAITVPTQVVSMCYALASTFLIASGRWRLPRWAPYAIGAGVASVLIVLAYALRTPIFNWLRR